MLVRHLKDCATFTAGDGCVLREFIHPGKEDLKLRYSFAHATVKPGDSTRPHKLKTSEVYYILEGAGEMNIDNEQKKVQSGHLIYIPPDAMQFIKNIGDKDLKFICIVDPAWRPEDEEIL